MSDTLSQNAMLLLKLMDLRAITDRTTNGVISFSNQDAAYHQDHLKELEKANYVKPAETAQGEKVTTSWCVTQDGHNLATKIAVINLRRARPLDNLWTKRTVGPTQQAARGHATSQALS